MTQEKMIRPIPDIQPVHERKILFCGMMGSGKTTTARILGLRMGWPVLDLDARIEHMTGMTIPRMFADWGEARFREIEHDCLRQVLQWPGKALVALGGGTLCSDRNWPLIQPPHRTIYLRCDLQMLQTRLAGTESSRPMLADQEHGLHERLSELMSVREPWYDRADHAIDVTWDGHYLSVLVELIRKMEIPC